LAMNGVVVRRTIFVLIRQYMIELKEDNLHNVLYY
jgi:hypothetical protein